MRNLFLMMVLAITTITSTQAQSTAIDSVVAHWEQYYNVVTAISDEPETGLKRVAMVNDLHFNDEMDYITAQVRVYVYDTTGRHKMSSYTVPGQYEVPLATNRNSYIDSTGAEVSDTTAGAFQEVYYLMNKVATDGILFQLLRHNVMMSDIEGKFDKQKNQ